MGKERGQVVEEMPVAEFKPPASDTGRKISEAVDGWFAERIHGTAVGHHTEGYNTIYAALPDLKARIAAAIEE